MKKKFLVFLLILTSLFLVTGCNKKEELLNSFNFEKEPIANNLVDSSVTYCDGFAKNIAVVPQDSDNSKNSDEILSDSALLIDATTGEVLFQKNPHKKQYPASTTKLLTSLIAVKYGDTNAFRKVGDEIIFHESNVVVCDFRQGDVVPFNILINGALLKSGNDAAACLALTLADNLDDFADMMNDEAKSIGATESHFVNPHGLYDEDHYTTAYDMYLIFNQVIQYKYLTDILSTKKFSDTFDRTTANGTYKISCVYNNTNLFVNGSMSAPSYINVIGGKAGYTELAKRSYIMLAEANGHKYIFVLMRANSNNEIYQDLLNLMNYIPNN